MRYFNLILAAHLLFIFFTLNMAHANHPGYDCLTDDGMHCGSGNDGDTNISNSEPSPESDNDQDSETPK